MSLQGNQIIPCHMAIIMVRVYPCQVLLIRCLRCLKLGRSLNWLLKNVKALVFQSNEPCDTHYYIFNNLWPFVVSLLPPFYYWDKGLMFSGRWLSHLV